MEEIICRFISTRWMSSDGKERCVVNYAKKNGFLFTAVGYFLPRKKEIDVILKGEWIKSKYGEQFDVAEGEYSITPTEAGIKAFLTTLVSGIGEKMAAVIYKNFGDKTFEVLDKYPERLLEIKGIKKKMYERIVASFQENKGSKEIISLLRPYGISPKMCVKINTHFKSGDAMIRIHENPYQLTQIAGIGFKTADAIGSATGITPESPYRLAGAVRYVLKEAESGSLPDIGSGHLCMPRITLRDQVRIALENESIRDDRLDQVIDVLIKNKSIAEESGLVFRAITYQCMNSASIKLAKLMQAKPSRLPDLDDYLEKAQEKMACRLAPEQLEAVKIALTSPVSIITGGPGTGKTTIISCILLIQAWLRSDKPTWLMAPTGRAARRMSETTGHSAATIHSALGIRVGDSEKPLNSEREDAPIDEGLIIVDEISMLDIFVADAMLSSFAPGVQLVFLGDSDQLPSVGPGAVLNDLLKSGVIPSVRLTEVFRQKKISRIAINAARMRRGNTDLEYGPDFQLIEACKHEEAAELMVKCFISEAKENGLDSVVLLSPFRKQTATGVDSLNTRLQVELNPLKSGERQLQFCGKCYRKGDRIMATKNENGLSNGDIGYILDVHPSEDDPEELEMDVDFGEEKAHTFNGEMLKNIDLAYATTIHKSQGSEYKVVIMTILRGHYLMLKRNLIYTGITRAREKVFLIADKRAIAQAIHTEDANRRMTNMDVTLKNLLKTEKNIL